jgi:hypothetical protein
MRRAEQYCSPGTKPHLIAPLRRDYLREPGDMRSLREQHPHRTPEWLPMVRCIGSFRGSPKTRDRHLSGLVVVWFQAEYAPPIQEPPLGQLLSLDWDSLATDFDFY